MVFSSFTFIYLFLPLCLLCYWIFPKAKRNLVLLAFSLLFYFWASPEVVFILIASSFLDYWLSGRFEQTGRKAFITFGVVFNVLLLCYFKYANFFVDQINFSLESVGVSPIGWLHIALPAGISFFTFEKISYLIDVYRKTARVAKSFPNYLLFTSLFPHLIAGPILKYHDLAEQIESRIQKSGDFFAGWTRFCLGLAKKVLIADEVGKIADNIFAISSSELTTPFAWLGIIAYSIQIYFDFAGYSDMAIGMARMFGFKFIENFNSPYSAQSMTDFWKRWHISLTNWMREYLYIPLGGNRVNSSRLYLNLVIVFCASGLWHGASWTFLCWGLLHGIFLIIDRLAWLKISAKLPKIFNVSLTYIIVLMTWVLFRSENFTMAGAYYQNLFDFSELNFYLANKSNSEIIHSRGIWALAIGLCFSFLPAANGFLNFAKKFWSIFPMKNLMVGIASLTLLILATLSLVESGYSPFLYYQF